MKSVNYQNKYYCSKRKNDNFRVDLKRNTIYKKYNNDSYCKYIDRLISLYGFIVQLEI